MKILHTADWHIGSFKGPEKDGINLRGQDTINCLKEIVRVCAEQNPDLTLVSGDIFHQAEVWQGRSHKEVLQAREIIMGLSQHSKHVIVMRGTPNHDSEEAFSELQAHFELVKNVSIITTPTTIESPFANVVVVPGFDRGLYRAKFPGLSREEENAVFTDELGKIVVGLRSRTASMNHPVILMAHTTVPGANAESGQTAFLTQFEPVITQEMLSAANYDLVALGHIHRPQKVFGTENVYYSGAANAMNFNDEGQERGFWIHTFSDSYNTDADPWPFESEFYKTPYREFKTITLDDAQISEINSGNIDSIAAGCWGDGCLKDKIVRIRYTSTPENNKGLNKTLLEKRLYEDGAFWVAGIELTEMTAANRKQLSKQEDPEENLKTYLMEKNFDDVSVKNIIEKARPIIDRAIAGSKVSEYHGTFEPVSIEVKNYRNYAQQAFDFGEVECCTINGQNGAGKSSLFLDAIIDCLYEEPREGDLTGWIRNSESARSGSISFIFKIGDKTFRVVRTRAKSGKASLNLSEQISGEWVDRSAEKMKDTQERINSVLGMDSMTMKACALIMQDQYGLFLEASKEDRMGILSNLLGLGIYSTMEQDARDKARDTQRIITADKKTIDVHLTTIDSYGDPNAELEEENIRLKEKKSARNDVQDSVNTKKAALTLLTKELEHRKAIEEEISKNQSKKTAIHQNLTQLIMDIGDLDKKIEKEPEVSKKVERYRFLNSEIQKLTESISIYRYHQENLGKITNQQSSAMDDLQREYLNLKELTSKADSMNNSENPRIAEKKAGEYEEKKKQLESLEDLWHQYITLGSKKENIKAQLRHEGYTYDSRVENLKVKERTLQRKVEILKSSGCIDPDNANCAFLRDAQEAKKELEGYAAEYEKVDAAFKESSAAIQKQMQNCEDEIAALGYDEEKHLSLKKECDELSVWPKRLKAHQELMTQLAVLHENIIHTKSNISCLREKVYKLNLEAQEAKQKFDEKKDDAEQYEKYKGEASSLEGCIEELNQFPVLYERKKNDEEKIKRYRQDLADIEIAIEMNQKDLRSCKTEDLDDITLQQEIVDGNLRLKDLDMDISYIQQKIGGLQEKLRQTTLLKSEIEDLNARIADNGAILSDYEVLKNAFSQDGIPHQIIRSLIPRITEAANSILGQMSGGKMGIEIQTEKVMKSNTNKEVVTLDVLIEDGNSVLPYLSKSGGEKVKASLSMILALAEIKATSAGIQLGMLFIDEPPFLDSEGIQAYCDALDTIQTRYPDLKIMAITHDNSMKARFPQSVDVIKTEDGSKIIYE